MGKLYVNSKEKMSHLVRRYSSFPSPNRRLNHSSIIKTGSIHLPHLANYILNLYLKTYDLECAQKLFDEIPKRDVKTWTLVISGFSKCGHHSIALDYFIAMQNEATVASNAFTLSSVLKCCASVRHGLRIGKSVHAWIITKGIDVDVALNNALLDLYAKFRVFDCVKRFFDLMDGKDNTSWNIVMAAKISEGKMEETLEFFRRLPNKSVSSWNTIIDGLLQKPGLEEEALKLLYQMVKLGYAFDVVTFSIALVLTSSLKNLELGRQIHGHLLRTGMNEDSFVSNSLLDMYCKCRAMHNASVVFRELQLRCRKGGHAELMTQTISWSTMIAGCVQNGMIEDAMRYFRSMILEKIKMDLFTLTTVITASAHGTLLELGQQVHAHTLKLGHDRSVFVGSSMIDMYAKCGKLDYSWSYFRGTRTRNVVLWSAMISSYATHGLGNEAIQLFELMQNEGIKPNEVSFLGLLTACSHAGLVQEGCKYFTMMKDAYGIRPGIQHFACMVDLFGRAGHLKEIKNFIYDNGIDHLKEVWKAYLSACWLHKNGEMASWVSKKLLELDPHQPESYLLASNTYSVYNKWDEAAKLRGLMLEKEVASLNPAFRLYQLSILKDQSRAPIQLPQRKRRTKKRDVWLMKKVYQVKTGRPTSQDSRSCSKISRTYLRYLLTKMSWNEKWGWKSDYQQM